MNDRKLFWGCFIAMITTAFGFIIRALIMNDWAKEFGLNETQKGEIFGVGLWPFAISIVLFSLFIDRIGYKPAMIFAFLCHVVSVIVTLNAKGYWGLYVGNFIVAIGNGTVEAVVNPVVATMFSKEKTKWLNILHAGWPGGLVLGGLLTLGMGESFSWHYKVGLILIPTILYGIVMFTRQFPINERVAAGVSDRDMLREFGMFGALIVATLIVFEVTRVMEGQLGLFAGWTDNARLYTKLGISGAISLAFGLFTGSLGRPLFIFLLIVMIPLATTELGTDSWITELMEPAVKEYGFNAAWILVYTSFIMLVLRFFAGPIAHKFSPLGLLMISAAVAAAGLYALSVSTGVLILAAATLYGFGKTFFWPTMLAVVSEQFPRGGALTLNAIGGVGMLSAGLVGTIFLGMIQDYSVSKSLTANQPAIAQKVVVESDTIIGKANTVDKAKRDALSADEKAKMVEVEAVAKKGALSMVTIFPIFMFISYALMVFYFKSKGGYKAVYLEDVGKTYPQQA